MHPELKAGKAFNIADENEGSSWKMIWPGIMKYLDLSVWVLWSRGKTGRKWVRGKKGEWEKWTREKGLRSKVLENTSWDFMTAIT